MADSSNNTALYAGGVIDESCDKCGATPLNRCKRPSGYGISRVVAPHKNRVNKAKAKKEMLAREREQEHGDAAVGGSAAVLPGTDPRGEPGQDHGQPVQPAP